MPHFPLRVRSSRRTKPEVGQGFQDLIARKPRRLEAPDLAARRRQPFEPFAIDDRPHHQIMRLPFSVVHIFIAGQAAEHRLAQKPCQEIARVLAPPYLRENVARQRAPPKRVIQLTIREQTGIGGDPAAVEFQLQPPVETDPERPSLRFTHRMRHRRPPIIVSTY